MPPAPIDVAAWRERFPLVRSSVYLRHNALGASPVGVDEALSTYAAQLFERGDDAWEAWYPFYLAAGDRIARLVGGTPGSVATGGSVSELLHRVAASLEFTARRDRVVVTELDFPTVRYAWEAWGRYGAQVHTVASRDGGVTVPLEDVLAAIDDRTAVVAVSLASYGSSFVPEVAAIAERAHDLGALVVVDAFQAFGILPIDVEALGADVLLGGCRKFALGSGECAFLYVRPELAERLSPALVGWMGHAEPFAFEPGYRPAPGARRFQAGTPLVLPLVVAAVGWDVLEAVGVDAIRARSLALTRRVIDGAEALGLEVGTPRDDARRAGVVALRFAGSAEAAGALNAARYFCSHRPGAGLRVAPHFMNTEAEVDRFLGALEAWRAGRPLQPAVPEPSATR